MANDDPDAADWNNFYGTHLAVAERLRGWGCEVDLLEERSDEGKRTADLRASRDGVSVVIEVKQRDPREPGEPSETGVRELEVAIGTERNVEQAIRKGAGQVRVTQKPGELGAVWVRGGSGPAGEAELEAAIDKLAGVRRLAIDHRPFPILGVHHGGFERLDFVVLEFEDGRTMAVLNPWSPSHQDAQALVSKDENAGNLDQVLDYLTEVEEGRMWRAPSPEDGERLADEYRAQAIERGLSPRDLTKVSDARRRREFEVLFSIMLEHPGHVVGGWVTMKHYEAQVEVPPS